MPQTVVYTCGTFDLFHRGHLRLLEGARALGDRLVVGVSTDELVQSYKQRSPIVSFEERIEIVGALRVVDLAIPQRSRDKYEAWERIAFDIWVVGDDWFSSQAYQEYRRRLTERGVRCVFLPYTAGVSSTQRRTACVG